MRDRIKQGIRLIAVDTEGAQLFSMDLGDWNAYDFDSQRDLGKGIAENLPDRAYELTEDGTLKPGVYDSVYGNAISWNGQNAYDLDMGEDVPFDVIIQSRFIRPLD